MYRRAMLPVMLFALALAAVGCAGNGRMPSAPFAQAADRPESAPEARLRQFSAAKEKEIEEELTAEGRRPAGEENDGGPEPFAATDPVLGQPAVSPEITVPRPEPETAEIERELLRLLDDERANKALKALEHEESIRAAARMRAQEVLVSLSHTRPDGSPYYTALEEEGFAYQGRWHGENVSSLYFTAGLYDARGIAAEIFDELKRSPGHYQNIVSAHFDRIGIGVYVQQEKDMVHVGVVQLFAGG